MIRILAVIIVIALLSTVAITFISQDNKNGPNDDEYNNESNVNYTETFVFNLLAGGQKNMSEYYGKIVLLDFMGANCGPCQNMMYVLKQLSVDYPEIEIVSIDVWIVLGETSNTLQQMINLYSQQDVDLDWTFGYDDPSGTLFYKYNIDENGVPLIHILDKNGNIYYTKKGYIDGYTDYSILKQEIEKLIS